MKESNQIAQKADCQTSEWHRCQRSSDKKHDRHNVDQAPDSKQNILIKSHAQDVTTPANVILKLKKAKVQICLFITLLNLIRHYNFMLRFVVQIYKLYFKLSHIVHKKLLFNIGFNLPQITCSLFFEFKTTKSARPKILKISGISALSH